MVVARHWFQTASALNPRNPIGPTKLWPRYPHDFAKENCRRTWQAESVDPPHWSQPYLLLKTEDEEDNIHDGSNGMTQHAVGNWFFCFLNVFHRVSSTMDVQPVISRDRQRWRQVGKRQPRLETGKLGSWHQGIVTVCSPPMKDGDDLLFYYGGCANRHDYWM